jgi:type III pantothenate kinase
MSKSHAAVKGEWAVEDYARRIIGRGQGVGRIIVSNVGEAAASRMLLAAARLAGAPKPEFAVSRRSAGGVTTTYLEPWRLGVDRFIAAIGAYHLTGGKAVCVVNVGTAITIDLVDMNGRHRGGAIVPGPALMVDSLLTRTSGIRRRAQGGASATNGLFAQATRHAIAQGSRYAAAAVIDRAIEEARGELGRRPAVLLTGGGFSAVKPLLRHSIIHVPDLVLAGLAVWAGHVPPALS